MVKKLNSGQARMVMFVTTPNVEPPPWFTLAIER